MRFIYRPNHPQANANGMVDASLVYEGGAGTAPYIISDNMGATRHMATGRMHTSKSEFRKDTKASGCFEIGNETSTVLKPRQPVLLDRAKRRDDIRRTIYNLRNARHD